MSTQPGDRTSLTTRSVRFLTVALATGGFTSFIPAWLRPGSKRTGAGVIGTLLGLAAYRLLPTDPPRTCYVLLGAFLVSVVLCDCAEEFLGEHDDPRIIIDEFVGFWVAVAFLPHSTAVLVSAFILFRIFDVAKWGWIDRVAQWPGGWGIVMDDVVAGLFANGILQVAHSLHWL